MVRVVPARLRVVPSAALFELSRQDADEADGAADTEHRAFRHALLAEGREGLAAPAARGVLLRHRRLTDRRRDGATADGRGFRRGVQAGFAPHGYRWLIGGDYGSTCGRTPCR